MTVNEENLRKLADGLLSLPAGLIKEFDMQIFRTNADDPRGAEPLNVGCGSAGCAIGWAPTFGIGHINRFDWWADYSAAYLIDDGENPDEWDWCFSSDWAGIDNTAHGAARRILWLLDRGLPEDREDQMFGNAPLCYMKEAA